MALQKLQFNLLSEEEMLASSKSFLSKIKLRRSVRHFSDKIFSIELIFNAIKSASMAPSGANKQPWHFVIVRDLSIKKEIRLAAEKEEKSFYDYRATNEWLKDREPFETSWRKPFLEKVPYLIVIFKKQYDLHRDKRKKNYYVNESVGIAVGFLLNALHCTGLVALTHAPSPMGFLEKTLKRPKNERAFMLIPFGYPIENVQVPKIEKNLLKKFVILYKIICR